MSGITPDFEFLRNVPIFKGLTDEALKTLLSSSTKETEEGIICRLSLSEMAAYLGTCEEVVSRILKEFRKEGAISRLGKKRLLLYPEKFNKS